MKTRIGAALVLIAAAAIAISLVPDERGDPAIPAPGAKPEPAPVAPPEVVPAPPIPEVVPEVVPEVAPEPAPRPPVVDREATALRGRILDEGGSPVCPACVFVTIGRDRVVSRVHAGLDGRFLVVVPAGREEGDLVVDAEGFLPLIRPIEALLSAADREQEFVLSPGLTITGHLRDETGRPVKSRVSAMPDHLRGAPVPLSRHAPLRRTTRAEADDTGRFVLRGLAPGRYVLRMATFNYREGEGSIVSCEAGASGVVLVLYRAVAVTLRIHLAGVDVPVTDRVRFSAFPNGERERSGETTSGEATLRGLPAGKCHLVVTAPNYRAFGRTINLSLDESPVVVSVPLEKSAGHGFGAIAGTVDGAAGTESLPPGVRVYVPEFGGRFGFDVGEKGRFEIERVPAGVYHVRAASGDGRRASRHETVTVGTDGGRAEVRLSLEPAGRVLLSVSGRDACEEASIEFRLYDRHDELASRFPSPRYLHLAKEIGLGSVVAGSARVLAVARGRIVASAEFTVPAGQDVRVKIALPQTAEGAPPAPVAPDARPRPGRTNAPPPPAAPTPEEGTVAKVAALVERLGSKEQRVRFDAVVALGKLGDATPVRTLVQVVENDPDLFVRRIAIRALGEQGRRALSAVPVIAQAQSSDNPFVADAAAVAIAAITGRALPYRKGMTKEEIATAAEKLVAEVEEDPPR